MSTVQVDYSSALRVLEEIESKKDNLVKQVEDFFNERGKNSKKEIVPVKNAQLQNLLRLAMATRSIKEIRLFIRYQCARHDKEWGRGENDFGPSLERKIASFENEVQGNTELNIELVRLFLGYFVREAIFRRPPGVD